MAKKKGCTTANTDAGFRAEKAEQRRWAAETFKNPAMRRWLHRTFRRLRKAGTEGRDCAMAIDVEAHAVRCWIRAGTGTASIESYFDQAADGLLATALATWECGGRVIQSWWHGDEHTERELQPPAHGDDADRHFLREMLIAADLEDGGGRLKPPTAARRAVHMLLIADGDDPSGGYYPEVH